MDKNILNAVAEVLKDERAKFAEQLEDLRAQLPDREKAKSAESDLAELKSSIEFLFEEVDKKTDSIDFELAVMTKKESEDFLFNEIAKQTSKLTEENSSALEKIERAISSLRDGEDGADGLDGKNGTDGKDGSDGIDNPAISPIEISADHKAEKGLIVKHRGGLWQAIRNTNGDPDVDSGNWKCFVDGVSDVDIAFDAKAGVYSFSVEKSNGEREFLSIDRMPAYLPPSENHKSVEGDYFLNGTSLNIYLDSEWVAVDLKGNQGEAGENGNRGRKGKDGVGISEIFVADGNLQILLTSGEVKDIYLDVLNNQPEEINQEIKRYAGIWHTSQSYSAGDVATMMGSLYVCVNASSDSPESSDDWALMVAPAVGGAGGGDSGGGVVTFPTYGLVGESAPSSVGKKFSDFTVFNGENVTAVGIDASGHNVKFDLTTDVVGVNPNPFRNAKGQFIGTPEELEALKNQRDVNEFLYQAISDIEQGDVNLDGVVSKTGGDDMEGPLKINAQDPSDGRGTNYVQTLGVFSKSDGSALRLGTTRDRVYIGHNDTSFNGPIKVEEIQSKKEGEGVPLTDEGTKDDHLITKGYVDGGDRQLQSEIEQIALALETLLVQREHGKWKYVGYSEDTIPRNAGEFALLVDDIESSNENIITLNTTDLDGKVHGFADIEVGDFLEVVDSDAPEAYALFVVAKKPEGTGIVNVEVTLKEAGLNIWIGETCEIRFFSINEQDINLTDLDNRYLRLTGGTMTGTLTVPRFEAKDSENEAVCLIAGKATGTATASRLTFSNTGYQNAYGSIEWHGQNADGWFHINKDVDFGTNGLHSVNNIRLVGNKAIQEAQTTRIKFDGKVIVTRTGDNKDGFTIKGRDDSNLLSVYHNSSDLDSINYTGKTGGSTNLATCGYVDSRLGGSKGALINHMERLWKKGNGTDGKTFYFQNQNGSPSSSMNDFRKFKWKLPASHYLMSMVSAGRDMGYIVVTNMSGQLQYQCQVTNSEKSGNYITLELDYENRYGSNMMGDDSYYIVHLFSFLREA